MEELWIPIHGFPGYSISDWGRVVNDKTGRIMSQTRNQQGFLKVGLMQGGRQQTVTVAYLVADNFMPDRPRHFDTIIHLDGNREHTFAGNLLWRPRHIAVRYHAQFYEDNPKYRIHAPIENIETGARFENSWDAATAYGLLEKDIALDLINMRGVRPTGQLFRIVPV